MKRTLLSACAVGLALSLSACGGGGGGGDAGNGGNNGGGSGGGGSGFWSNGSRGGDTFALDDMTDSGAALQPAPSLADASQTANALVSLDSGLQTLLTGAGWPVGDDYWLKAEAGGSVTLRDDDGQTTTFTSGNMSFYKEHGVDFTVMAGTPRPDNDHPRGFSGAHTERDVVWLGRLDYAAFGYIAEVEDVNGAYNGQPVVGSFIDADGDDHFYRGKTAHYSGAGRLDFAGLNAGTAEYEEANNEGFISLTGTSTLTMTDSTHGTLVVEVPDFYKFTGSVSVNTATGVIAGNFTGMEKLGNAFPMDVPAAALNRSLIRGQLYGATIDAPSETAGRWSLEYEYGSGRTEIDIDITGVFGMKRLP